MLVQTDPAQGQAGMRQLVIDRRESPFQSRDTPTIGLRSFPTSELYFDDVEVPEINLLGGWKRGDGAEDPARAFQRTLRAMCNEQIDAAVMEVSSHGLELGRVDGCAFRVAAGKPCGRPSGWCDLHHVQFWRNGGPTDADNGVLLCSRHHDAVHLDGWTLTYDHPDRTVTVSRPSAPAATAGGSSLSNLRNTEPRSRASV